MTWATEEQVVRLLLAAEPYQTAYLRALVQMGWREAELIHTRLGMDLNLKTWRWVMHDHPPDHRCGCPDCKADGWQPKGDNSYRALQVLGEVRDAIQKYLEDYPAGEGDYCFRDPATGRIWTAAALAHDFRGLCERADVTYGRKQGITLHSLRHTCATNLIRAGVRESVVAKILGDTVETIVRYYVHLTEEDTARGLAKGPRFNA